MKLFTKGHTCPIVTDSALPQAVLLAARDLQRDLRRLSGQPQGFAIVSSGQGIRIQAAADGREEAYRIEITEDSITITGSDVLGTVFGIYAFSTHFFEGPARPPTGGSVPGKPGDNDPRVCRFSLQAQNGKIPRLVFKRRRSSLRF